MDEQSPQLPSLLRPFAKWLLDQVDRKLEQRGIGTRYISGTVVRGTSSVIARVGVRLNSGATTYERRRINLIEGANVSIGVVDDAAEEEVEITIGTTTGPHEILSASHSDSDSDDTPAEGDVLTYQSGAWTAAAASASGVDKLLIAPVAGDFSLVFTADGELVTVP